MHVCTDDWATGADATFDGGSLASRADVVVVTINHRLNIFGELGVLFPLTLVLVIDGLMIIDA